MKTRPSAEPLLSEEKIVRLGYSSFVMWVLVTAPLPGYRSIPLPAHEKHHTTLDYSD